MDLAFKLGKGDLFFCAPEFESVGWVGHPPALVLHAWVHAHADTHTHTHSKIFDAKYT